MILLDTLKVLSGSDERTIELYQGDLTNLTPDEGIDILIVSAFPNDYIPTPASLIGALYRKGVSVAQLSMSKAIDLRQTFSCWMSQEVFQSDPGIQFKRILCFEPLSRGRPSALVGDVFQAMAPFLSEERESSTVAMPILASGDQGYDVSEMLRALLDAAVHWMTLGLPLKKLKIVAHSDSQADLAKEIFTEVKGSAVSPLFETKQTLKYDVFISYAHQDGDAAALITKELQRQRSDISIFMDRLNLQAGTAWQPEIFEAIDACKKVIVLFSPSYLTSKVCKEEFNIAWIRGRDADENYLFPIYLYTASLPTYMKYRQYIDCREYNEGKIKVACSDLLSVLT